MITTATSAQYTWMRKTGTSVPIISAPMGGAAGGELAEAVSRAGALGMIGMGSSSNPAALEHELRKLTPGFKRIGIGLIDWVVRRDPSLLERALDAMPALLSVSFGQTDPRSVKWIARAQSAGVLTAMQVATPDEAQFAEDAGVDLIVARGSEAGGHGRPILPLLPLMDSTLARVSIPVIAAGGISTRTDLARVIDAGAAGAWVGTAFAVCHESLMSHEAKNRLVAASADETVVSRVMDVALGYPWPADVPERLISTPFEALWRGRESLLQNDRAAIEEFRAAARRGDTSVVPVNAGCGVERVQERRSAAAVVASLTAGLERPWDAA